MHSSDQCRNFWIAQTLLTGVHMLLILQNTYVHMNKSTFFYRQLTYALLACLLAWGSMTTATSATREGGYAPVMGVSLGPQSRVPIAIPMLLAQRQPIPKLTEFGTAPVLWMAWTIWKMSGAVWLLLAPQVTDSRKLKMICINASCRSSAFSMKNAQNFNTELSLSFRVGVYGCDWRPRSQTAGNWTQLACILFALRLSAEVNALSFVKSAWMLSNLHADSLEEGGCIFFC